MKISALMIATVAAQEPDRKVPPRTPPQRLNTLRRFAKDWIDQQIGVTINRPNRAANMKDQGIARLFNKMSDAYAKDCHFFSPSVLPHGGPNPETQGRKRRWVAEELERVQREADQDNVDFFDEYFIAEANGERTNNVRLSNDVDLALKQINTGFRKWILRYISDCHGQKEYDYHTKRLAKIFGNVKEAWETVGAAPADNDYGSEEYSEG